MSGEASAGTELPMVGFVEAIGRGFSNYFTFSGRGTRAENWWWALFTALVGLIPFAGLVTLIPSLAVGVRLLHDINRTGYWLLLGFVPVIGWVALIVWAIERGAEGQNNKAQTHSNLPHDSLMSLDSNPLYSSNSSTAFSKRLTVTDKV